MALPAHPGRAIGPSQACSWLPRRRWISASGPPDGGGDARSAAQFKTAGGQDCGVKAIMASPNAARLASQARRGEVTVSS
jgi:hypothetical protein